MTPEDIALKAAFWKGVVIGTVAMGAAPAALIHWVCLQDTITMITRAIQGG